MHFDSLNVANSKPIDFDHLISKKIVYKVSKRIRFIKWKIGFSLTTNTCKLEFDR